MGRRGRELLRQLETRACAVGQDRIDFVLEKLTELRAAKC